MVIKMAEFKTNVYRIFDSAKLPYTPHTYEHEEGVAVDGVTVAERIGIPVEKVFKTLVTQGSDRNYYVFDVPVAKELDLKKAAKAVGVKNVEMIHVADINKITGYVRGGCSPVGMKKQLRTVFASQALAQETILVSAGKIGYQVEVAPQALIALVRAGTAELTIES